MFGTIMHNMAEAHLVGEDPFALLDKIDLDNKKMFRRELEMYGNIIQDMRDIMVEYFDYWSGKDFKAIKGPDGRKAEHEFRIELARGLWFTGKIDAIAKDQGLRWLVEHKTFNRQPSEDDRWRSVQAAVYFKALYELGFERIDGVLWDYIWSKPPSVPTEKLQNGNYSLKKINSLPTTLKRWIKEEELDKKLYVKLLAEAKDNRQFYYKRVYSPVKVRVVDNIWNDFLETAREIQEFHGEKKAMTVARHCSWCDYQPLCKAEMVGSDVDWILKKDYVTEDQQEPLTNGDDRTED